MKNVNSELQDFITEIQGLFELKYPVAISVRNLTRYQGFYELRLCPIDDDDDNLEYWHDIKISTITNRTIEDFMSTVAHEFVHAWQHEQGLPVDHGESFRPWIKHFHENYSIDILLGDYHEYKL